MISPTHTRRPATRARVASVVLLAWLPAASTHAAEPPKAKRLPIVDQAIDHHGGDRYRASRTTLEVCSKSGCFQAEARVDGDNYRYEATRVRNGVTRRVRMTNDTVSAWQNGKADALTPDREQRHRDWVMQRIYFAFLPYRLNDSSVWKQDLGLETWGDQKLHKVKVSFTPGSSSDADDTYMYWFDPATGEVVQFAYDYKGSPGGLRFRQAVNHRRIGGILFFDQENYGAEGDGLRVDQITPRYAATLRLVSTVRFENIAIEPIED